MSLGLLQVSLLRRQFYSVDPSKPRRSLRSMFKRVQSSTALWEYQNFRGTAPRPQPPNLDDLVNSITWVFPYLNWRLLMRSYITKLKQRVRERRLQRRVKNTLFYTVDPTEFYQRLAVGV